MGLEHQRGRRFTVLVHQYCERDVKENVLFAICTSPITHLVTTQTFCITFIFNFFLVLQWPQEKRKTMLNNFWGAGGEAVNKVYYGRRPISE